MEINVNFDLSALYIQIFKSQAKIDALIEVSLPDDKIDQFNESYKDNLRRILLDFEYKYPDSIPNINDLFDALE